MFAVRSNIYQFSNNRGRNEHTLLDSCDTLCLVKSEETFGRTDPQTHITSGRTRLATLCAGYADGLPRSLRSRGALYLRDRRLPIVGRVSMDSVSVDISGLPDDALHLGGLVELIGPHQTLEMLAADAGTIAHELLTGLDHRFRRVYR